MKQVLTAAAFAALTLNVDAALSIVTETNDNGSATNPITWSSIAVAAGDVVVVSTSVNKPTGTVDFSLSTTAGGGDVSGNTTFSASQVHAAHISYLTVVNAGTYDFTVNPSNASTFTSNSTIYVLRADTNSIGLADSVTIANTASPTITSLDYTFASSITAGDAVAIEALTSQSGAITIDTNYSIGNTGGAGKRNTASSTVVSGSNWTGAHSMLPIDDDFAGAGIVFVEQIPEPSSSILLLTASTLMAIRRRR